MTLNSSLNLRHLIRSTGIVMLAFLMTKLLGMGRQIVVAQTFGTSSDYDAFIAAFRLPDILFMLISGGALGTAFIPILSQRLIQKEAYDPDGWRLISGIVNTLLLVTIGLSGIMAIFALPLVQYVVAPGFDPASQLLTANMMRLTLLSTVIFSISSLAGAVLHAHQHFILPAIAPLLYNAGIMGGAIFLADRWGVYALIWGAIAGALGHLLIQLPGLFRYGFHYQSTFGWSDPALWQVIRLMGPRILNIIVIQINFVVIFNLASRLGSGTVSALDYGWDLMQMPQTIIGSAIGIVLFPTLSELAAQNDIPALRHTMAQTLRIILALAIPAMVGMIVLGHPIIQLLFQRGEFDAESTAEVYQSLQFWALALLAHSFLEVVNRVFYAQKDTVTPFLSSVVSMGINLGLALLLYRSLRAGGLALSNGVAVTVEVLIMLVIAHRRMAGVEVKAIGKTLLQTSLAAGTMGAALLIFMMIFPTLSPLFMTIGGGGLGIVVYLGIGLSLGMEEIRWMPQMVRAVGS